MQCLDIWQLMHDEVKTPSITFRTHVVKYLIFHDIIISSSIGIDIVDNIILIIIVIISLLLLLLLLLLQQIYIAPLQGFLLGSVPSPTPVEQHSLKCSGKWNRVATRYLTECSREPIPGRKAGYEKDAALTDNN